MYWFATCNFFASKEKETAIVHRENVAGCRHSRPKRQMRRNINEPELVNRIIGGDSRAMKELYDSHVGFLMAAASRYIPDDDDVKDVLQESFVKIYTSISKFNYRGDGSLRAWMTRIVVNEAIDFLDRNKRNGGVSAGEPAAEEIIEDEYDEPDAGQVPIEVIHDMIRRLPEGYRKVFNLYVFEGQGHREIAKKLNISESTSASQLHRAKAMLARQINSYKSTLKEQRL